MTSICCPRWADHPSAAHGTRLDVLMLASFALQDMPSMTRLWPSHTPRGCWPSMAETRSCACLKGTTTASAPDPSTPKSSCSSTSACNARMCSYQMSRTLASLSCTSVMLKGPFFSCSLPHGGPTGWLTLSTAVGCSPLQHLLQSCKCSFDRQHHVPAYAHEEAVCRHLCSTQCRLTTGAAAASRLQAMHMHVASVMALPSV